MAQPPLQTASADDHLPLRHPVPDVLPRQGPLTGNIDTLEQSAERLSLNSRAGDAIHRLNQDLKRRDGRTPAQRSAPTSRQGSLGSFYNVFPRGHVITGGGGNSGTASARRSVRSRSSSHVSSTQYAALTQDEGLQEPEIPGDDSESGSDADSVHHKPASVRTTRSSIRGSLRGASGQYTPLEDQTEWPEESHTPRTVHSMTENEGHASIDLQRSRAGSNASTRTYQPSLFKDFDGAHYSSIQEEEESEERDQFDVYGDHLNPHPQKRHTWLEPPPDTSMVYYPAPVPQMLNLPKRLSLQPPPAVHNQRRSQVLSTIGPQARMSVQQPSLEEEEPHAGVDEEAEPEPDNSQASTQPAKRQSAMAAHLRASVFFERPSIPQSVPVRDESAVATLDSFLNASASTPASAFTDHPIVGNILDVYAKEKSKDAKRRSTMNALSEAKFDPRKSRSMLAGSRMSLQQLGRLRLRGSKNNLLDESPYAMDRDADYDSDMEDDADRAAIGRSPNGYDNEYDGADYDDAEADEDEYDEDEDRRALGPPTTLLAELQMRKAELRQRNRTAVQAFPNGMHATLLELDAVAQIEKKRRRGQRTALAWEDPNTLALAAEQEGGGDDDVPLGVLFPSQDRLINRVGADDWDRPLGLIEQKFREDNEPLSARRNRLLGLPDELPQNIPDSQSEASEHEGETLAERTRRLKTLDALNSALPDKGRPTSADFASELRSQLGVEETPAPDSEPPQDSPLPPKPEPTPDPEETLGQRRRRLQAEGKLRAASSGTQPPAPPLANRTSMSNLLAANAGFISATSLQTPVKYDPIRQNGLLSLSAQQQAQQRQDLLKHNMGQRIPSTESHRQSRLMTDPVSSNGLLGLHAQQRDYQRQLAFEQLQQQRISHTAPNFPQHPLDPTAAAQMHFHNTVNYNNMNLLAAGINPSAMPYHAPGMMHLQYQYSAQPNAGMMPAPYGHPMNGAMYPPAIGTALPGMGFPGTMGSMGFDVNGQPLDDGQRDAIESWRQSVL